MTPFFYSNFLGVPEFEVVAWFGHSANMQQEGLPPQQDGSSQMLLPQEPQKPQGPPEKQPKRKRSNSQPKPQKTPFVEEYYRCQRCEETNGSARYTIPQRVKRFMREECKRWPTKARCCKCNTIHTAWTLVTDPELIDILYEIESPYLLDALFLVVVSKIKELLGRNEAVLPYDSFKDKSLEEKKDCILPMLHSILKAKPTLLQELTGGLSDPREQLRALYDNGQRRLEKLYETDMGSTVPTTNNATLQAGDAHSCDWTNSEYSVVVQIPTDEETFAQFGNNLTEQEYNEGYAAARDGATTCCVEKILRSPGSGPDPSMYAIEEAGETLGTVECAVLFGEGLHQ